MGPVVVAGGSGELGQWMVRCLLAQGVTDVRVVDINAYPGPERVRSIRCTLSDPDDLPALREALSGAETVVSMVMPPLLTATEREHIRCNVDGVLALLKEAREAHVRSFVYISSIAVMNHFISHHQAVEEDMPDIRSYNSCYDRTKRVAEDVVLAAHNVGGMWTCSLRLGSLICSPRSMQVRTLLGPVAFVQAAGKPIDTNHGINAAWGIWLAIQALGARDTRAGGEPFLLTRGAPLTVKQTARMVADRTKAPVWMLPAPAQWLMIQALWLMHRIATVVGARQPGLPPHLLLSIAKYEQTFSNEKAQRVLGYHPLIDLDAAFDLIVAEADRASSPAANIANLNNPLSERMP
jgi:sterol-4alpha-carboxylate 3-dehydrogenase (decarboxylating)